jgi:hypothetical protein
MSTTTNQPPPPQQTQIDNKNKQLSVFNRLHQFWYEQSGTTEILALKQDVRHSSQAFDQASVNVTHARRHLEETLRQWEIVNGQHLQLLQRRESWTATEAQQFADVMTKEVTTRHTLDEAKRQLQASEEHLTSQQLSYMNAMRKRYHEEQIWQDQWRIIGTFGTWSLIGLNTIVFMASQYMHQVRESRRLLEMQRFIEDKLEGRNATVAPTAATAIMPAPVATLSVDEKDDESSAKIIEETTATATIKVSSVEAEKAMESAMTTTSSIEPTDDESSDGSSLKVTRDESTIEDPKESSLQKWQKRVPAWWSARTASNKRELKDDESSDNSSLKVTRDEATIEEPEESSVHKWQKRVPAWWPAKTASNNREPTDDESSDSSSSLKVTRGESSTIEDPEESSVQKWQKRVPVWWQHFLLSIQSSTTNASKEIHLPSVVLGVSVTGMAVLVSMALSTTKR